jgi:hypothetical protein
MPERRKPTTIEAFRLTTSATTPVGTSNKKYVPSSTVPMSTSCKGSRPTSRIR